MKGKISAALIMLLIFGSAVSAQDYEDYSYGGTSSPSLPLTINGEAGVKGRMWFGHMDTDETSQTEYWDSDFGSSDDIKNAEMEGSAYGKLEFEYSGDITDVDVKFKVDSATVKDYPEDILEEASIRGYFGNWVISGGKMKIVWGKGDKLHVLDNFNANDYTDFIFPDYIDRRLAEPMFSIAYNVPNQSNLRFEAVVTPMMTADRFAESGVLVPAAQKNLTETAASLLLAYLNDYDAEKLAKAMDFSSDDLYENNIKSLRYAQAGFRMTGTFLSLDWGFSYYYGHYKQPSLNLENYISFLSSGSTSTPFPSKLISLDYDRLQILGFEAATVLWKLNMRGEFAYNLTEDTDGDNPWVKNNSISWVGGFDIDLPIHNVNFNIQETGTYILHSHEIKNGDYALYDVDYNTDGNYHINKIVLNISDKWLHDKISTECITTYGIENKEWCVQPKIEYNPSEGLFLTLTGAYLYSDNENGEFYSFTADNYKTHRKFFSQVAVKYTF